MKTSNDRYLKELVRIIKKLKKDDKEIPIEVIGVEAAVSSMLT